MAGDQMFIDLLRQRRSARVFTSQPVEPEKQNLLVEAALRAPSSRGRNPWEFIVVDDPILLEGLGQAKEHGSAFLGQAPLAIVVAADTQKCDVWIEDCSIAAILIQLAAEALGLGSCWAQIRHRPHDQSSSADGYVRSLLELPDHYAVECIIGVGYPESRLAGHAYEDLNSDQVHHNKFTPR